VIRVLGVKGPPRIAIADDAGLIYSDDWRMGWLSGFKRMGCEVMAVDVSSLRRASGGGILSSRGTTAVRALSDSILKWKPDLVWCHHGRAAGNESFLSQFKRRGIPTAVYLCDEPYEVGETARYSPRFDFVFTMDLCTLKAHLESRPQPQRNGVFYLPACVDDLLFTQRDYSHRPVSAFFLGNPMLKPREPYLRAIEKLVAGADIRYWPRPKAGRKAIVAKGNPDWIPWNRHPEFYASCVVGLNIHRDPGITADCFRMRVDRRPHSMAVPTGLSLCKEKPASDGTGFWNDANLPASHVNPRFFEMAACGTLVVSDDSRSELRRMFPMAPRAADVDHFVELVLYYIAHQDEAEEIGAACSRQVLRRHTYQHRVGEVLTRVGLMELVPEEKRSSLGAPLDWLSPQDSALPEDRSRSEPTGPSERWSPASGLSWTRGSGSPKDLSSLDVPQPWLS
jgi:spore maturation protein CgeB